MGAQSPETIKRHNLIPGFGSAGSSRPKITTAPGTSSTKSSRDTRLPPRYQPRPGFAGIADEIFYQGIQGIGLLLNGLSSLTKRLPDPVRDAVRDSTNALPFSANLFSRYALGLGGEGVKAPDWMVKDVNRTVNTPDPKYRQQYEASMNNLNQAIGKGLVSSNEAERLRDLYKRRLAEKTVIIFPDNWSDGNVLDSGRTGIGHAFLKNWYDPNNPAHLVDKYDFSYGGETIKEAEALKRRGLNPDKHFNAARSFAATAVDNLLGNQEDPRTSGQSNPGINPGQAFTNIGRGITSVLPTSNAYDLKIPIPKK